MRWFALTGCIAAALVACGGSTEVRQSGATSSTSTSGEGGGAAATTTGQGGAGGVSTGQGGAGGATPSCDDQSKDQDETDVDCGGSCAPCPDGAGCAVASDCTSLVCTGGVCAAAACDDGVKNEGEGDVDCGGPCPACTDGEMCGVGADCESLVCNAGICAAPACDDGALNQDETDVDCGGSCAPCADGKKCSVAADCESLVCTASACQPAACDDGVQNGGETSVDCGGSCPACDPDFSSVVLLLHMDGSDGSTTFTDEKGHPISTYGDAAISTASSKFGGAAGHFDGSGDYLTTSSSSDFDFNGSTPFTIEAWIDGTGTFWSNDSFGIAMSIENGDQLQLWINGVLPWDYVGTNAGTVSAGWHHVALTYDGTTYRVFVDGAQTFAKDGTLSGQSGTFGDIGSYQTGTQPYFDGYIDELRVTRGVARYTAAFAPPQAAFPDK